MQPDSITLSKRATGDPHVLRASRPGPSVRTGPTRSSSTPTHQRHEQIASRDAVTLVSTPVVMPYATPRRIHMWLVLTVISPVLRSLYETLGVVQPASTSVHAPGC